MRLIVVALATTCLCSCSTAPPLPSDDPCAAGEATYACQVQRYRNVNM